MQILQNSNNNGEFKSATLKPMLQTLCYDSFMDMRFKRGTLYSACTRIKNVQLHRIVQDKKQPVHVLAVQFLLSINVAFSYAME